MGITMAWSGCQCDIFRLQHFLLHANASKSVQASKHVAGYILNVPGVIMEFPAITFRSIEAPFGQHHTCASVKQQEMSRTLT